MKKVFALMLGVVIMSQLIFVNESMAMSIVAQAPINNVCAENNKFEIWLEGSKAEIENPIVVNEIFMVPIKPILDKLGYTVKWDGEKRSVDIFKGVHFTSLKIGENSYFKHKMAPKELSAEPIIYNNRTYVPIEFIGDILGICIEIDENRIVFSENLIALHSGYIQSIDFLDKDNTRITLSSKEKSEGIEDQIIINISKENTIINKKMEIGKYINTISPPFMTMSIPGQTGAYIIY